MYATNTTHGAPNCSTEATTHGTKERNTRSLRLRSLPRALPPATLAGFTGTGMVFAPEEKNTRSLRLPALPRGARSASLAGVTGIWTVITPEKQYPVRRRSGRSRDGSLRDGSLRYQHLDGVRTGTRQRPHLFYLPIHTAHHVLQGVTPETIRGTG